MTLLEEKKMVAEWLKVGFPTKTPLETMWFKEWNPQANDCPYSEWSEIWGNMDDEVQKKYKYHLSRLVGSWSLWLFHTAKPAICWQALIKTLEE